MQFEDAQLPPNYDHASPYTDTDVETIYTDSSWKPLSGGMETHAVDLAKFGWLLLDGKIVTPAVRDGRISAPVQAGCGNAIGGTCANGLGWLRTRIGTRTVYQRDGSWQGHGASSACTVAIVS